MSDCRVLELSLPVVFDLIESDAGVAAAFVTELGRGLDDIYATLAASAFGSMRERIAGHLVNLAAQDETGLMYAAVTQQQLADSVGTVREVVARVLRELRREGVIGTETGRVQIRDAARLATIVGGWRDKMRAR